jgi:hypothetical protein
MTIERETKRENRILANEISSVESVVLSKKPLVIVRLAGDETIGRRILFYLALVIDEFLCLGPCEKPLNYDLSPWFHTGGAQDCHVSRNELTDDCRIENCCGATYGALG